MLKRLQESKYTAWIIPPRGLWLLPFSGLLYSFLMLSLNFDRGLDITDESLYVLWASHPGDFPSQITQFGHYTGILYWMVAGNLEWFRLSGLLVLLTISGFFAVSLDAYCRLLMPLSQRPRWMFISLILSSTLVYYGVFPLWTPSYNWLALCGTLLVATGLLRAATSSGRLDPPAHYSLGLVGHGVLVGTGGVLAFVAKPTAAAALAFISVAWVLITKIRDRWATFLSVSSISCLLFLVAHVLVFENGLDWFFVQTVNALELYGELAETSRLEALLSQPRSLIMAPWLMFRSTWVAILLLFGVFVGAGISSRRSLPFEVILFTGLVSAAIVSWLQLWRIGFWLGGPGHGMSIGIGVLSFSFVLALSAFISKKLLRGHGREVSPLRDMGVLYLFLISLPIAYSFGTSNGLIPGSSTAVVFYAAAALSITSWIDSSFGKQSFSQVTQLLITLSVVLIIKSSLENPYRLAGTISDQTVPVSIVGSEHSFFVDEATADYVVGLKTIALDAGWESGTHLIDLTGASPGAVVVLDGRAPGVPWILGGYQGSDRFALAALSLVSNAVLENAWVLTAPNGTQSISALVLSDLNLDFPDSYESLGTVTSGHRNEEQVLWRPKN